MKRTIKVCLISPPQINSLDDKIDPPLGLLYVAASIRDMGIEVRVADLASRPYAQWEKLIGKADVYGIEIYTCNYPISKQIKKICKKLNPKSRVVAGGAHPTALPEQSLRDFDIVIKGEADLSIKECLKDIMEGKQKAVYDFNIPQDLDELSFPARDLIDIKNYHRIVGGKLATSIITSRGCPYKCAFCNSPMTFKKMRYRSNRSVVDEIKLIIKQYGIRNFIIYDDIFTLNRTRLYPLLDEFKKLRIKFRCNGRADRNNYEDFVRLKEAGCTTIAFGAESGSQDLLDRINKKCTVKQNIKAIKGAKRAGLITKVYLIVGIPGENKDTIQETKGFMETADPDEYTLFTFIPLPGSDTWEHKKKYGIRRIVKVYSEFYNIAGQGEGGLVTETDSYNLEELMEMREDLKGFLTKRGWRGDIQEYFKRIKWR